MCRGKALPLSPLSNLIFVMMSFQESTVPFSMTASCSRQTQTLFWSKMKPRELPRKRPMLCASLEDAATLQAQGSQHGQEQRVENQDPSKWLALTLTEPSLVKFLRLDIVQEKACLLNVCIIIIIIIMILSLSCVRICYLHLNHYFIN